MNLLIYLLKVSACTGVFFIFYKLILSRFTFFTINRWYLLGTLLISFLIPMITIPASAPQPLPAFQKVVFYKNVEPEFVPTAITQTGTPAEQPMDWASYLPLVYVAAAIALALKLVVSVLFFFFRIRGKQIVELGNVKVVKGDTRFKNGSFLNYVFLDEQELSRAEVEQILAHELVHIRLWHSADTLFVQLVQVALWFNPFSYFYQKAIIENHEFETDREVTQGKDKKAYAELLLRLSVSVNHSLYSNFSMVPLKTRINMLFNKPTKNMKKIIYILILPLAVISCLAFANRELISKKTNETQRQAALNHAVKDIQKGNESRHTEKRKISPVKIIGNEMQSEVLSVINGIEKLGKSPLVFIDGKSYGSDILYKISALCIKGSAVYTKAWSVEQYGKKGIDGVVKLTTKNGSITYLTDLEKQNLRRLAAGKNSFYSRTLLTKEDGSTYEQVRITLPDGTGMACSISTNDKVGFLAGQKLFDESAVKNLEALAKKGMLIVRQVGPGALVKSNELDLSGYDIIFKLDIDTLPAAKQGYRQKVKGHDPVADAKRRAYYNSADYKAKSALANKVSFKTMDGVVKEAYSTPANKMPVSGVLVEFQGNIYLLDNARTADQVKTLKKGDRLIIEASGSSFTEEVPYVIISPARIEKDGKVIFKRTEKPIEKTAFGFESNRARLSDCKIVKISKTAANTRLMTMAVDGFTLQVQFDASQTRLSNLDGYKVGDEIRIHFVHEVKTGPKSYFIKDWLALSKERRENAYDVKNEKLFLKFYEKVAALYKIEKYDVNNQINAGSYTANDSVVFDHVNQQINLFGRANYTNENFSIRADHIKIDNKNNTIFGTGKPIIILKEL